MLDILLFYLALGLVLILPGHALMRGIVSKKNTFSQLEIIVLSIGSSIIITDFLLLILGALHIPINRLTTIGCILLFTLVCYAIVLYRKEKPVQSPLFHFSKKQVLLIVILVAVSLFIRSIYIQKTIVPSATDLGHHMFWANEIVKTGKLPNYQQQDIVVTNGNYTISKPKNISDFIIGEHLIFAAISLISGISVLSYFPALTLLFINIITLFAIFILTIRFFAYEIHAKNIAITLLFILGPLFAIAPPQAKFITGGVIGNMIGNLLLPLALYAFYRAFHEKNTTFLTLALFFSMGLFYTHHLTALLFMLALVTGIAWMGIIHYRYFAKNIAPWLRLLLSKSTILYLFFAAVFALAIYTPTYITNKAVDTVVGGPSKAGHEGLTLTQFKYMVGEPRLALALSATVLLIAFCVFNWRKKKDFFQGARFKKIFSLFLRDTEPAYHLVFLFSWITIILIISLVPFLIKIDIPSGRVANYGTFPLSILASYAFVHYFVQKREMFTSKFLSIAAVFTLVFLFLTTIGLNDNAQNIDVLVTPQRAVQTFHASDFLSHKITPSDILLSDHIYIPADSWIKLFFMRGYNFPFYRANLDRYENGIDRQERCTLNMISSPNLPESQKCFKQLGVTYVMVSKNNDAPQFQKNTSLWQVYSNDEINIYYKPLH